MQNSKQKICLTGGGTGGSVTPLLAIADELRAGSGAPEFYWLGSADGPEREMTEKAGVPFRAIAGGKLRRYFAWENLLDVPKIAVGFFEALAFMARWQPDLVMSAGSYVSVPVVWAAALLRIPVMAHQQDVRPGLANKLMAPFARVVTVTFEKSLYDYGAKAVWTGNPIRRCFMDPVARDKIIKSNADSRSVILIIGGGTGAASLNLLIGSSLTELTKHYEVIHITGKNKLPASSFEWVDKEYERRYHAYEFLHAPDLAEVYRKAGLVISRCGMGTLTELSYFGKAAILVPLLDSHQEDNARVFAEKEAAIVLGQKDLTTETLLINIERIFGDVCLRQKLENNMRLVIKAGANAVIAEQAGLLIKR